MRFLRSTSKRRPGAPPVNVRPIMVAQGDPTLQTKVHTGNRRGGGRRDRAYDVGEGAVKDAPKVCLAPLRDDEEAEGTVAHRLRHGLAVKGVVVAAYAEARQVNERPQRRLVADRVAV